MIHGETARQNIEIPTYSRTANDRSASPLIHLTIHKSSIGMRHHSHFLRIA